MAPFKRRGRREDSSQESREQSPAPTKSRRPANTALRQQRLLAWSPVLTPRLIILTWSILAVFFLGLGGWLFYLGYSVRDITIDYTDCLSKAPNVTASGKTDDFDSMDSGLITAHFLKTNPDLDPSSAQWQLSYANVTYQGDNYSEPFCTIKFNIPEAMGPTTVFYYVLRNFYQNHRRYVTSFDAKQLLGDAISYNDISGGGCKPLTGDDQSKKPYFPCGLIANSMFNDTFDQILLLNPANATDNAEPEVFPMTYDGIAWSSEQALYGSETKYDPSQILPPPNWSRRFPKNYTSINDIPKLKEDYHFQNWMRTAAVPNFSKLFMRNDNKTMEPGKYQVRIGMNYDVTKWNGRKSFQISTLSLIGGRNLVLGIVFLAVGGACLIMTIVFVIGIFIKPRKLGDHTYLSWNQAPGGQ